MILSVFLCFFFIIIVVTFIFLVAFFFFLYQRKLSLVIRAGRTLQPVSSCPLSSLYGDSSSGALAPLLEPIEANRISNCQMKKETVPTK